MDQHDGPISFIPATFAHWWPLGMYSVQYKPVLATKRSHWGRAESHPVHDSMVLMHHLDSVMRPMRAKICSCRCTSSAVPFHGFPSVLCGFWGLT